MTIQIIAAMFFTVLMMAVVVWDFRYLRIPNVLNFIIVVTYYLYSIINGVGFQDILYHTLFGIISFSIFLIVALLGKMGGGDVKLAGAIGLWVGTLEGFAIWMITACFIYVVSLTGLFLARKYHLASFFPFVSLPSWLDDVMEKRVSFMEAKVPFGVPLALGAVYWALQ